MSTLFDWALENKQELISEWDYTLNKSSISTVTAYSKYKAWWSCDKCYGKWQASIYSRTKGKTGCPYCAGKKVLPGYNDLATKNPDLALEWNTSKNEAAPTNVRPGSHRKVWWKGKCGHEWEAEIKSRAIGGNGCPYCSGQRVLQGYNDLATINPVLAFEWDEKKNGDLSPDKITSHSNRIIWWKCSKCGHEWKASVYDRNDKGYGCSKCSQSMRTSTPEKSVAFYLEKAGLDIEEGYHNPDMLGNFELDCYIPSKKIAIEYDGAIWHSDTEDAHKKRDARKHKICSNSGI